MRFDYCPQCGTKLILREIGDEGPTPFCTHCERPWFDMFSTCAIILVYNDDHEVLVLRQDYLSTNYRNMVSGYMKPGESAEECARREVEEEVGLTLDQLEIVGTYWFARSGVLMIGFMAHALPGELKLSIEVDDAYWSSIEEAAKVMHPREMGSVTPILLEAYEEKLRREG